MRNFSDKICRENQFQNCGVYNIIWKTTVESDRAQITIQNGTESVWFACQTTKAKIQREAHNTEYLICHRHIFMMNQSLSEFAQSQKASASFIVSICPHVSAWLLLEKFLWNLVFVTVTKICWEIQIWLISEKNIENFTRRPNMFHVVGSDTVAQQ
jgi:hypothetical protein